MEWLDVVDEDGSPTGVVVEREEAHRKGIRHRTSHVWLYRVRNGKVQLLLQRRSENKDSFPGCYDISSAGHIPAGEEYLESAVRELKEELGVSTGEASLVFAGMRSFCYNGNFHEEPFLDRQVTRVYILRDERDEDAFQIQEEELSGLLWMDLSKVFDSVRDHLIPNCIYKEELEIVNKKIFQVLNSVR